MALEVREREHGVVVGQARADGHGVKPLATLDGPLNIALAVGDVHWAEGPTVDLEGLEMLLGGVAIASVVGVGLDDGRLGEVLVHELGHPLARDDVGPVLLAGMQLDGHLAIELVSHLGKGLAQAGCREVAREPDDGRIAVALVSGNVDVSIGCRCCVVNGHSALQTGRWWLRGRRTPSAGPQGQRLKAQKEGLATR